MIGNAFVAPLLREESIEKEIKPIDTEFVESLNSDAIRVETLFSHLCNSDHPFHKFMQGNRKSLIDDTKAKNINVHQQLHEFHQKYYQPENIVVVVQAQESLDNLEEWTSSIFSQVPSTNIPNDIIYYNGQLPFTGNEEKFNQIYYVEALDAGTRLQVFWFLPPVLEQYLTAPKDFWSALIGYEGKGSLINVLRKKNLALELYTFGEIFSFNNNRTFSVFQIEIELTDNGSQNLNTVVQLLFEYLAVIVKSGVQEYYYREHQTIKLTSFNNKFEKDAMKHSIKLTKNMLFFPTEHLLTANFLFYHYDKNLLDNFGNMLTPDNACFVVLNKHLNEDLEIKTEPWMNIRYQCKKIPKEWIDVYNKTVNVDYFFYPKPNPFITTNFDLLSDKLPADCLERSHCDYPFKIVNEPRISVWHKTDFKYGLPKTSLNLHLMTPFASDTTENCVCGHILQEYLNKILQEDTYDAQEAELYWSFSLSYFGMSLAVSGFNEKLSELLFIVLERFATLEKDLNQNLLESIKKDIVKIYKNYNQDSFELNNNIFYKILSENHYTYMEYIHKMDQITDKVFIEFIKKYLENISFQALFLGKLNSSLNYFNLLILFFVY